MKKFDPKMLSLIENSLYWYSVYCKKEKLIPRVIVRIRDLVESINLFVIMEKWHQVTDAPDLRRIIVFKRGT
ncbi:hypothetical protein LOK48_06525 (plasmid) [Wolbachia endosymbiont of Corcyra cephalonica]|nr:hypothetical protein [Wolbachia endosymbiont of Corcyra cephalonica]UFO01035.1 hypothetical protein LOK48_06525 [Wolbachia endosymbiont of Corcyra cephalonica]